MKLQSHVVEKPWGRTDIPEHFGVRSDRPIGEIWFQHPAGNPLPLLSKYLFTSEKLSVQVHPNDTQANALGHMCGKDEMWIVLDSEEGADIGIGLRKAVSPDQLARAAQDGSIVDLMEWRAVTRGDVIYNPAGNIHALGAGLVVLEIQQAIDLTYRLYDYGRARDLHLEKGLAVSSLTPLPSEFSSRLPVTGSALLAEGPIFQVWWAQNEVPDLSDSRILPIQILPINGNAIVKGETIGPGECAIATSSDEIELDAGTAAVLAYCLQPGS